MMMPTGPEIGLDPDGGGGFCVFGVVGWLVCTLRTEYGHIERIVCLCLLSARSLCECGADVASCWPHDADGHEICAMSLNFN